MKNIFKHGFTLSETLITLTIVGIVAILVVPGLIKDTTDKARITLLQSTVSNLNNMVQNELVRSGSKSLANTRIVKNPEDFLNSADSTGNENCFAPSYEGVDMGYYTDFPDLDAIANLKNGVCIGLGPIENDPNSKMISIDINGKNEPNKLGIDYFELKIEGITDYTTGQHVGDVGSFTTNLSNEDLINDCKNVEWDSGARSCYILLEQSGFDPHYLD